MHQLRMLFGYGLGLIIPISTLAIPQILPPLVTCAFGLPVDVPLSYTTLPEPFTLQVYASTLTRTSFPLVTVRSENEFSLGKPYAEPVQLRLKDGQITNTNGRVATLIGGDGASVAFPAKGGSPITTWKATYKCKLDKTPALVLSFTDAGPRHASKSSNTHLGTRHRLAFLLTCCQNILCLTQERLDLTLGMVFSLQSQYQTVT